MDLIKGNHVHAYTLKEQMISRRLFTMVMDNPLVDINAVLQYTFEDTKLNVGRMVLVYAFTEYFAINHTDGVLKCSIITT